MLNKLYRLSLFSLKYIIKRNIPFVIILLILFGVYYVPFTKKDTVLSPFKTIDIQDDDDSELSRELIDYIIKNKNYTISKNAINKLHVPYGFEENYKNGNATLKSSMFGVTSKDICLFEFYKFNETNKIKFVSDTIKLGSDLLILVVLVIIVGSIANYFITARLKGKLYFISNHLNFWVCFLFDNAVVIFIIIGLLFSEYIRVQHIILLLILMFAFIIFIYKLRKNSQLLDRISWVSWGTGFVLLYLKLNNFHNYPIVDLLFEEINPIIIIDIILLIVLFLIVKNIKLTEK